MMLKKYKQKGEKQIDFIVESTYKKCLREE